MPQLSIIVPVYNEVKTIRDIIEKLKTLAIDKEIIVVNDGSTDGTQRILQGLSDASVRIVHHSSNRGKGAAVRTGLGQSRGEFVIIQDADLEYDPKDYFLLLEAMMLEQVDLVLGVRFTERYHGLLLPKLGNRLLTFLMNSLYGARLNDVMTCYKLFRRSTFDTLNIESCGFDIEIEFMAKALKKKLRIKEIPVSYEPRNYSQGKRIRIRDGLVAVMAIVRHRLKRLRI